MFPICYSPIYPHLIIGSTCFVSIAPPGGSSVSGGRLAVSFYVGIIVGTVSFLVENSSTREVGSLQQTVFDVSLVTTRNAHANTCGGVCTTTKKKTITEKHRCRCNSSYLIWYQQGHGSCYFSLSLTLFFISENPVRPVLRQNIRILENTHQKMALRVLVTLLSLMHITLAFAPTGSNHRSPLVVRSIISPLYSTRALQAVPVPVPPNPFKKLPWNVEKEKERQARKFRLERNKLHRELGIAEDATYEEIVDATNILIARAGGDIKRKIQIEVAKDKILQIRLNERLAGLATSKEARAQSNYEIDG